MSGGGGTVAWAKTADPETYLARARALLQRMPPPQRVGQLFVVRFLNSDVSPESAIAELITDFHIGGVQLTAANSVLGAGKATSPTLHIAQLVRTLQGYALFGASGLPEDGLAEGDRRLGGIPLLIVVEQDASHVGRGELREISQGLTPLPSQLALGATWNVKHAQAVGEILGREYAALGVNVLIGPRLDLNMGVAGEGDLGTRSFGGDPFWVGKLGAAFVSGVHQGSAHRVAVVARSFPGLGVADRDINETIPSVQRSLDQLRQFDLQPFFAVMQGAPGESAVDGVVATHIRYRGFQGNIRASTRPFSVDPAAHQVLMSLPEVAAWRSSGGVVFSDALGLRSLRRFYDPIETTFNGRRIAQEAFLAGNDVLLLGSFGLTNDWREQLANIKDLLTYFASQYVQDVAFAERVDESVLRILALKLRLYEGDFAQALVPSQRLAELNSAANQTVLAAVARDSATALIPVSADLPTPAAGEPIVFFTDDRLIQECPTCPSYPAIDSRALEEIALNLYGPRATGLVSPTQLFSFTFSDLSAFNAAVDRNAEALRPLATSTLPAAVGEPNESSAADRVVLQVADAINRATWIVFAMIDADAAVPSAQALRAFLAGSADMLRDKRVVVFAFGAPYYLSATEIGKLSAYYGLYSRSPAHLDVAVKLLFGALSPRGSSPVSIPALNYNVLAQTAPDPRQVIPLLALSPNDESSNRNLPALKIGDRLTLRAGPVLDSNGRIVPDGTQVQFVLGYPSERVEQRQPMISTRDGMAELTITLERRGRLEIRVEAEPALTSDRVILDIADQVSVETIRPTPQLIPTFTPPALTSSPAPSTPAVVEASKPAQQSALVLPAGLAKFALTLLTLSVISAGSFLSQRHVRLALRVRHMALAWIAGWLAYIVVVVTDARLFSEWPWAVQLAPTLAAGGVALMLSLSFALLSPPGEGR